jgi:dTDP-glucose 4,6-dehydratase
MRSVLITGGAGFIGSALVAEAMRLGCRVVVVDNLTYAGHPQNLEWLNNASLPGSYQLVVADVRDQAHMLALMQQHAVRAVIHAAAESHVDNSISGSAPFMHTNILGTHSMLEASRHYLATLSIAEQSAFRFVHISTDEVYGALQESGHFTLASPMLPNSPYAASKAASDHLARAWHVTYGLPVLITRCCNNYGPRQHPEKLIPRMILNARTGKHLPVYGTGLQVREWVHVDDHARGVFAVLERAAPGSITHLGSGEESTNLALVQQLCAALQEIEPSAAPYASLITHVEDRLGHDFRYSLDLTDTKKQLNFSATIALPAGLRDTIAWYVQSDAWVATMLAHKTAER